MPVLVEIADDSLDSGTGSNPDLADTNLDPIGKLEVGENPLFSSGASWNGIPAGIGFSESGSK